MKWITDLNWNVIKKVAIDQSVPWRLIGAIIQTESSGNQYATRYEPHFKYLVKTKQMSLDNGITEETEIILQKMSWSYTQIMGGVARELGFDDDMPMLCGELSILFGTKLIKKIASRYTNKEDIIAAYNMGSVIKAIDGKYKNQIYVDKVLGYLNTLESIKSF